MLAHRGHGVNRGVRAEVNAREQATYRIEPMNNEPLLARQEAEAARAIKSRLVATVSPELRGDLLARCRVTVHRFVVLSRCSGEESHAMDTEILREYDQDAMTRALTRP